MSTTFRVVTRGSNGELRIKEYEKQDTLLKLHTQIGIDDCSTDLKLRGMPVFRGLIGPMPDGKEYVRYERFENSASGTLPHPGASLLIRNSRRRADKLLHA
jgi:hypothetical protein